MSLSSISLKKIINTLLFQQLGINKTIAWVIAGRTWSIIASPITVLLIGTKLNAQEQGYYFTFANLLSITMFFELGLGGWITRFSSYEMSNLTWDRNDLLVGKENSLRRLSSIMRFATNWYTYSAIILFVVIFPIGILFFKTETGSENISWLLPWFLVVFVASLSLLFSPYFSFLEGCGKIKQMMRLQFFRVVLGNIVFWICLIWGLKLLSSPILNAVGLIYGGSYLYAKRNFFLNLRKISHSIDNNFNWKHELLPLQWRTAVTVITGFFAWQTANPILFKLAGPIEAGKLGMSLSIATVIQAFGMAWINTNIPTMSIYFAQNDLINLKRLFRTSIFQVIGVVVLGSLALIGFVYLLNEIKHPFATRMLTPFNMFILMVSTLSGTIQLAFVLMTRTYKKEPFVFQMIVFGFIMPLTCYLSGNQWGITGMLLGMCFVNIVFGLIWTIFIFRKTIDLKTEKML